MEQYHNLLKDILENGEEKNDRTEVGTLSVFGRSLRFDLKKGFPVITTKKLAWKSVVGELLWMIEGSGDERRLCEITYGTKQDKVTIWTPNSLAPYWKDKALYPGDLGRVYGVQWRNWRKPGTSKYSIADDDVIFPDPRFHVDQLYDLLNQLKKNPYSRRHILTAWNPGEIDDMALPPCHVLCQFYVNNNNGLSCHMYQRSVDVFLGLPFNIASYALLTHLIAHHCNFDVDELVISTGDTHIYIDHVSQVKEQLSRTEYALPNLVLNKDKSNIFQFNVDDIKLENYISHDKISATMAV
jgi:thymidylate synthase